MTLLAANSSPAGLVIFVLVVVAVAVGVIASTIHEKKRREAFQRSAGALGFQYCPLPEIDPSSPVCHGLELFSLGRQGGVSNCLKGSARGVEASVFDYRYVVGSGKNRHACHQTVALFVAPDAQWPAFALRPENIFHRIGQAFGYQDIDFPSHPKFSQSYLLRGADEAGVRALFSERVREYFEGQPEFCVEAAGRSLIVFRYQHRVSPENLQAFLETGLEVLSVFGVAQVALPDFRSGA